MYTNPAPYPSYGASEGAVSFGAARDAQKRGLRRLGNIAGLCVIASVLLEEAFSVLLQTPTLNELYFTNETFRGLLEMLFYVCVMFVPFISAYLLMRDDEREEVNLFGKPTSKPAAVCGVLAGFFCCAVGNYIAAFLTGWIDAAGLNGDGGVPETSDTVIGLLFDLLTVVLLPPLIEEFALRGVVMQPLRKYGDVFAILSSAFVFGMLHGDAAQIPFAFLVGAAIGFIVVATGSIWVGVAIHFGNNLFSLFQSYLYELRPPLAETVGMVERSAVLVFGFLGLVLLLTVCKHNKLQKAPGCVLSAGEKVSAFFLSVPMVIAIIMLIAGAVRLLLWNHG